MSKKVLSALGVLFIFATIAIPSYAASSTFLTKAQEYYNKNCNKKNVSNETSLECYVFDKVAELDGSITTVKNKQTAQEAEILSLKQRVATLEASKSPEPKTITFANNRPQPFDSEWINVEGYDTLAISLSITGSITQYAVHFTNDVNALGFTEQLRVECGGSTSCPLTTIPVLAKYYRISTGTATGNITSQGFLSN